MFCAIISETAKNCPRNLIFSLTFYVAIFGRAIVFCCSHLISVSSVKNSAAPHPLEIPLIFRPRKIFRIGNIWGFKVSSDKSRAKQINGRNNLKEKGSETNRPKQWRHSRKSRPRGCEVVVLIVSHTITYCRTGATVQWIYLESKVHKYMGNYLIMQH